MFSAWREMRTNQPATASQSPGSSRRRAFQPNIEALEIRALPSVGTAPQVVLPSAVTVAQALTLTASFADPDSTAWIATVDYGDNTGVQPLPLHADRTFDLKHTYAGSGPFRVAVEITDAEGQTGRAELLVQPDAGLTALPILPATAFSPLPATIDDVFLQENRLPTAPRFVAPAELLQMDPFAAGLATQPPPPRPVADTYWTLFNELESLVEEQIDEVVVPRAPTLPPADNAPPVAPSPRPRDGASPDRPQVQPPVEAESPQAVPEPQPETEKHELLATGVLLPVSPELIVLLLFVRWRSPKRQGQHKHSNTIAKLPYINRQSAFTFVNGCSGLYSRPPPVCEVLALPYSIIRGRLKACPTQKADSDVCFFVDLAMADPLLHGPFIRGLLAPSQQVFLNLVLADRQGDYSRLSSRSFSSSSAVNSCSCAFRSSARFCGGRLCRISCVESPSSRSTVESPSSRSSGERPSRTSFRRSRR